MSSKKYLAIDLGASSGRGIVGEYDGGRLTLRENCRVPNQPVRLVDRLYWDILRIFHEIKQSIHRTSLDDDKISSLGIDTWGVDYALLDSHGHMMSSSTTATRATPTSRHTFGIECRLSAFTASAAYSR